MLSTTKIVLWLLSLFISAPVKEIKVVNYNTEYLYSSKYSEGEELIIQEGEYGYSYLLDDQEVDYKDPVNQIIKVGTHKNSYYKGILTGYASDCKGCSATGTVACRTANKKTWSLINDGIIYDDSDYGEVNIVASDNTLFPCGTIIEISNNKYDKILAVVLDTGYTMRKNWRNNKIVHLDLAFSTSKQALTATNRNTNYHVKRWGW